MRLRHPLDPRAREGPHEKRKRSSYICPSTRPAQHCTERAPWAYGFSQRKKKRPRWTSSPPSVVGHFLSLRPHFMGNHWGNLCSSTTRDQTEIEKECRACSVCLQKHLSRDPRQQLCPPAELSQWPLWSGSLVGSSASFGSPTNRPYQLWSMFQGLTQTGKRIPSPSPTAQHSPHSRPSGKHGHRAQPSTTLAGCPASSPNQMSSVASGPT